MKCNIFTTIVIAMWFRNGTSQITNMNSFITNWTFSPWFFIRQRQIMQNTWPTIYMTTSRHFGSDRMIQTNRTLWLLTTAEKIDLLDAWPLDQKIRWSCIRCIVTLRFYDKLTTETKWTTQNNKHRFIKTFLSFTYFACKNCSLLYLIRLTYPHLVLLPERW